MGYYDRRLAGERLRSCYALAPPRVQRSLAAEIAYACQQVRGADSVLELGCGYGRVVAPLARAARWVVGIDTAMESVVLARREDAAAGRGAFAVMDAARLGFTAASFDAVVCIQNGIAVFGVDPVMVFAEALRVLRPEGLALFSTYDERFWPHRLDWFERQAQAGLIGEIDREHTREGTIVCKDGFRAAATPPAALLAWSRGAGGAGLIDVVDESSVFCALRPVRPGS